MNPIKHREGCQEALMGHGDRCKFNTAEEHRTMRINVDNTTDLLETVLTRTRGRYLSDEQAKLVELLMCYRKRNGGEAPGTPTPVKLTDKEMIVFLMDEIDKASQWIVEGQTHMATGVLGQCHAEIRKHLSR